MAANGISELATKELRQIAKLDIAQAKRQGKTVATDGTISGDVDATKPYYRSNNVYDVDSLPKKYSDNDIVDNANSEGLLLSRPWVGVVSVAEPETIQEALPAVTLTQLQIWYDGADTETYVPNATDEGSITQWTDKSAFAHNANPLGGATTRPSYENTSLQNGHGYLEFDGTTDGLSVNPTAWLQSLSGVSVFVVSKLADTTGQQYLTHSDQQDLGISSNSTAMVVTMAGATGTVASTADTSWAIHTLVFDGTQATNADKLIYRKDKTAKTLSFSGTVPATTSASNTALYFGVDYNEVNNFAGYIGEVLVFTKTLTSTEYQNVENYLSTKWGL